MPGIDAGREQSAKAQVAALARHIGRGGVERCLQPGHLSPYPLARPDLRPDLRQLVVVRAYHPTHHPNRTHGNLQQPSRIPVPPPPAP
eukprot:scaffold10458_cov107-Isochrysis_galbana.AAC.4